jgi:hypothetical protein
MRPLLKRTVKTAKKPSLNSHKTLRKPLKTLKKHYTNLQKPKCKPARKPKSNL